MSSPNGTTRYVHMDMPHWQLLERYRLVINAKRHKLGRGPVTQAQLGGALIAFVLGHHAEAIVDELAKLRAGRFAGSAVARDLIGATAANDPDAELRGVG